MSHSSPEPLATGATRRIPIVVAQGDGIGPEIMSATLRILEAAGAPLECHHVDIGEKAYLSGATSGIPAEAWDLIRTHRVMLKAPITTPQGGGYKSLNVTLRKSLSLYANVRPVKAYVPFVDSKHPGMDLVIVRENEEDLYGGIEYRQSAEVFQALKLVSRPGCERIVRYAFEYARAYGRRKVTCMTKDNIMKLTDGLFHRVFDEIAAEYPELQTDHQIIDIGAARLADTPERLDVIVTLNLYGDIISDIAAQIAGSVGLAGSANIGPDFAMFEAIHGSAPDIAGRDLANPSGLLVAATQLLVHVGASDVAETVKNAWLRTLEDGIHTPDVFREGRSTAKVGTQAFGDAVIARLGQHPSQLQPVRYRAGGIRVALKPQPPVTKQLVGIDVFLAWDEEGRDAERLAEHVRAATPEGWTLRMITNRGVKVWPEGLPETFRADHWRCRFMAGEQGAAYPAVLELLGRMHGAGLEVVKTEHLYTFDGTPGYSMGQGE